MGGAGGAGGATSAGGTGTGGTGPGGSEAKPVVVLETSMGTMQVELEPELMPSTTANFLTYVDEGFYSGTLVHRVIIDFVIQGGGFTSGMTPKTPTHAPIALETHPDVLHVYGAISMARTNDPNSATSQFFLVNALGGAGSLDGSYAAFGKLIAGSDVLDAITQVPTETQGNFDDVPVTDVTILSATRR
jgi:cyclophilin family peptidyl-prolyl cis-trans isomerase